MKSARTWTALAAACAAAAWLAVPGARADTVTVDGVEWTYSVDGGEATIESASPASGNLTIPAELGECPVTCIGYAALEENSGLTSVTIPDSVRHVFEYAFYFCTDLADVSFGSGVEYIMEGAFFGCTALTDATLPDGTISIGDYAFQGCEGLKNVTIPDSVESIGDGVFYYCSALESISIPYAFKDAVSDWGLPETCKVTVREPLPLSIATDAALPVAMTGVSYWQPLRATGGLPPYTWEIVDGNKWPEWLDSDYIDYWSDWGEECPYLSGWPEEKNIGTNTFTLRVTDAEGKTVTRTFTLVVEQDPNNAPVFESWSPEDYTVRMEPGGSVAFAVVASDPDGDDIEYSWTLWDSDWNWLNGDLSDGATCDFSRDEEGTFYVQCRIGDGAKSEWQTWRVIVAEKKPLALAEVEIPTLLEYEPTNVWLGVTGGWGPYTLEIDGDIPDGMWYSGGTGSIDEVENIALQGTPSGGTAGSYAFTVRVTDSEDASVEREFSLIVAENPDAPPQIDSATPGAYYLRLEPGATQAFSVEAYDPNGGELSYYWYVYDPDGEQLYRTESGGEENEFEWTFDSEATGEYKVSVEVANGSRSSYRDWYVTVARAKTVYVDAASAADDPDGTSWATAFATLAEAADAAETGDTVMVAAGVYAEEGVYFQSGVALRSRDGAATTVLDGEGRHMCVAFYYGDGFALDGFTLRNGRDDGSTPAAVCEGAKLSHCIIEGCVGTGWRGVLYDCDLENCVVTGNRSGNYLLNNCRLWNCTVAGNAFEGYYGALNGDCAAWNSIVWQNIDATGNDYPANWGWWTDEDGVRHLEYPAFTNCCVAGFDEVASEVAAEGLDISEVATGCFGTDPKLVDAANGDVRLRTGSPCIDAGAAEWVKGETDAAGNARVQGKAVDLGAYEGSVDGFVISVRVEGMGTVTPMSALVPSGGSATFTASETAGRPFTGWAKDGTAAGTAATFTWTNVKADGILTATFGSFAFYVDAVKGDDGNDGLSWAKAKKTIQAAVDEAGAGETVMVRPGTYGAIDTEGKGIRIESTGGAAATVIDGGGETRCAYLGNGTGRGSTLAGFTLRNGATGTEGGSYVDLSGGGAFGGTLWDCVVEGNRAAQEGGGLYDVEAHRCRIVGNAVENNGGGYAYGGGASESVLYNCLVASNTVLMALASPETEEDRAYAGGGGVAWCGLHQCTVADNSVSVTGDATGIEVMLEGGGGCKSAFEPGNIFYGNTANGEASDSDKNNGACLIGVDPLFVDRAKGDYRLGKGSPAVDRGWTDVAEWKKAGTDTDLAGQERVQGKCIDLGCYESSWEAEEAGTTTVDGTEWWYAVESGNAIVVGGATNGAVAIPGTLGGHPVTGVAAGAFESHDGLTGMDIPDGVTDIGDGAFRYCGKLASVKLPSGLERIGDEAFYDCYELAELTIPDGVKSIGEMAFVYCRALVSLSLPDSVEQVGSDAFHGCDGLKTLSVPGAWEGTDMLAGADVPKGCKVVYREAPSGDATTTTPVAVPHSWLAGYPKALADAGGDYEKAAMADYDGDGAAAWEEYVAGTDPEKKDDVFRITKCTWADGKLVLEYGPQREGREYAEEAAETPDGKYLPRSPEDDAAGKRPFYRVTVTMP